MHSLSKPLYLEKIQQETFEKKKEREVSRVALYEKKKEFSVQLTGRIP